MRMHPWLVLPIVLAAAIPWVACGSSSVTTTTTGTGGHTTSHTTTTGTGGSAPTTLAACDAPATAPSKGACYALPSHPPPASCKATAMDGGTPDAGSGDGGAFSCGSAIPMANACGMCVESSCCAQITACNAIPNCIACAFDSSTDPAKCMDAALTAAIDAINTCEGTCCQDICSPPCNPVDNAGCSAANMEACDVDLGTGMGYTCFKTTMGAALCQMCDEMNGPFCGPGMTCLSDGSCAAFCCDDKDCGTGKCDKTMLPNNEATLGVCVHK